MAVKKMRQINYAAQVRKLDKDIDKKQNGYEFSNDRDFKDPGRSGGAYTYTTVERRLGTELGRFLLTEDSREILAVY